LRDRGDLQHHPRADSVGLLHQIAGIAEREGDDPRPRFQRVAKHLRIQGLRDVVYRKRPIGERFYHIDVAFNQPALIGYRSREFSRRARPHRRQDDRHLEAEEFVQACLQHCSASAIGVW
jgi:hypothetical protein